GRAGVGPDAAFTDAGGTVSGDRLLGLTAPNRDPLAHPLSGPPGSLHHRNTSLGRHRDRLTLPHSGDSIDTSDNDPTLDARPSGLGDTTSADRHQVTASRNTAQDTCQSSTSTSVMRNTRPTSRASFDAMTRSRSSRRTSVLAGSLARAVRSRTSVSPAWTSAPSQAFMRISASPE